VIADWYFATKLWDGGPDVHRWITGGTEHAHYLAVSEGAMKTASAHGLGVLAFGDVLTAPTDAPTSSAILWWDDTANELKLINDAGTVYTIDKT
jgi:hypothetical protein